MTQTQPIHWKMIRNVLKEEHYKNIERGIESENVKREPPIIAELNFRWVHIRIYRFSHNTNCVLQNNTQKKHTTTTPLDVKIYKELTSLRRSYTFYARKGIYTIYYIRLLCLHINIIPFQFHGIQSVYHVDVDFCNSVSFTFIHWFNSVAGKLFVSSVAFRFDI